MMIGRCVIADNYIISASDTEGIKKYLDKEGYLVKQFGDSLIVMLPDGNPEELIRKLFENGYSISSLRPYKERLEDRFIRAIEED